MAMLFAADQVGALVGAALAQGYRVVGPRRHGDCTLMARLAAPADLCREEITTRNSMKEFFFPPWEKVFTFRLGQKDVTLGDGDGVERTLIIGGRACDGEALVRMDKVFGANPRDAFYVRRREATTVVTIVCDRADEACFCTSLGFSPRSAAGSDLLLVPLAGGRDFSAEAVTEKGTEILGAFSALFREGEAGAETVADPPRRFDKAKVKQFLDANFEHPLWKENFLGCLGCAACTYLCPTCHCFDMVDEGSIHGGARFKHWDTCQSALFTRHTSGHNPRPSQDCRWRQRLRHKFTYYVDRFGAEACVGCGRCVRACPASISILDQLEAMDALGEARTAGAAAEARQ